MPDFLPVPAVTIGLRTSLLPPILEPMLVDYSGGGQRSVSEMPRRN